MTVSVERAILAGGCFGVCRTYCVGILRDFNEGSYTGGEVPNATYRNHGSHAEAVEITFDLQTISYRKLLEFFSRSTIPRR